MAYTKNTWRTGDIVSSQKLNHMEDGIANSENVLIVGGASMDGSGFAGTLDKTWQEIHDAMQSKICVVVVTDGDSIIQEPINCAYIGTNNSYLVTFAQARFSTNNANGYPASARVEN